MPGRQASNRSLLPSWTFPPLLAAGHPAIPHGARLAFMPSWWLRPGASGFAAFSRGLRCRRRDMPGTWREEPITWRR